MGDRDLSLSLDYFQAIREDEMAWIAAGQDASVEFQKKYLAAR